MTAAPFGADYAFSVGATVQFTGDFAQADGSAWPVDDYDHEWGVWDANGCKIYTGTPKNGGIVFTPDDDPPSNNWITFTMGEFQPCAGTYTHAYRMRVKDTGEYIIPFDGVITITGNRF